MLHLNFVRTALMLAFTIAAGVTVPVAASPPTPAATLDISGRYDGTVSDSVFGPGEIFGDLPQYQNSVSGILTFTFGSLDNLTPASFLLNGSSLTGNGVFVNTYGHLCPTSITATYTSSGSLKGSYKVINAGCSRSAGTFTMKHICSYGDGPAMELNSRLKRC
jgi:hypothetical protein